MRGLNKFIFEEAVVLESNNDASIIIELADGSRSAAYPINLNFLHPPIAGEIVLVNLQSGPSSTPQSQSGQRLYYTTHIAAHGLASENQLVDSKTGEWESSKVFQSANIDNQPTNSNPQSDANTLVELKGMDTLMRSRFGHDLHMYIDGMSLQSHARNTDGKLNPNQGTLLMAGDFQSLTIRSPKRVKVNCPEADDELLITTNKLQLFGRDSVTVTSNQSTSIGSDKQTTLTGGEDVVFKNPRIEATLTDIYQVMQDISKLLNEITTSTPLINGTATPAGVVTGAVVPMPSLIQKAGQIITKLQTFRK